MPFEKGHKKVGGRDVGTQNKVTRAFKEAVLNVFEKGGGEKWLLRWAKKKPTEFFRIAARLIPTEVTGTLQHAVASEDQKAILDLLGREGIEALARLLVERAGKPNPSHSGNGARPPEPERVH